MMLPRNAILCAILWFTILPGLRAQQLHFSGKVIDENGEGLARLTVRVVNQGEDTTTQSGEFSIPLRSAILGGSVVGITIEPGTWVLRDYPDGLVTVRREDAGPVILRVAKKGSLSLLTDDRIRMFIQSVVQAKAISQKGALDAPNLLLAEKRARLA